MFIKGAVLAVLVSLVCVVQSFSYEPPRARYSQWVGELSLGFAPTFFNIKYDDGGTDGDWWVRGFAFSCDWRTVYKPNGFCFAVKMLIGGVGSDANLLDDYGLEGFAQDAGDLNGWDCWVSCTAGKRFEYNVFTFTPTLGLGASYLFLEGDGQVSYSRYTYYYDCDVSAFQVALCADLTFGVMFTDNVGISASFLVGCTLFGGVSESVDFSGAGSLTEDYNLDFGCFSFIPSLYLTARL